MRFRIMPLEERIVLDATAVHDVLNSYHLESTTPNTPTTTTHDSSVNQTSDPNTRTATIVDTSASTAPIDPPTPPNFTPGPNETVINVNAPVTIPNWATNITGDSTNTFDVTAANPALFTVQPTIDPITGTLTFQPAPNAIGSTIVTATLFESDNPTESVTKTFSIDILPPAVPFIQNSTILPVLLVDTTTPNLINETNPELSITLRNTAELLTSTNSTTDILNQNDVQAAGYTRAIDTSINRETSEFLSGGKTTTDNIFIIHPTNVIPQPSLNKIIEELPVPVPVPIEETSKNIVNMEEAAAAAAAAVLAEEEFAAYRAVTPEDNAALQMVAPIVFASKGFEMILDSRLYPYPYEEVIAPSLVGALALSLHPISINFEPKAIAAAAASAMMNPIVFTKLPEFISNANYTVSYVIRDSVSTDAGTQESITAISDKELIPSMQSLTFKHSTSPIRIGQMAGISISDINPDKISVRLNVDRGSLDLVGVSKGSNLDKTGLGTGNVTLKGTVDQINRALSGLTFKGSPDYVGTANLSITATDYISSLDKTIGDEQTIKLDIK